MMGRVRLLLVHQRAVPAKAPQAAAAMQPEVDQGSRDRPSPGGLASESAAEMAPRLFVAPVVVALAMLAAVSMTAAAAAVIVAQLNRL